ncbi:AraC family transcriptional regulator [Wenyingzhuangia fucanilytica]|uniref:AraC family transcriptional regulator n=1 Tax=Wenyingzhuangia fucanilytica TaxID=1790137 RepID=A0A1B1Y493_9FLAO|nr:helix-turn-helix transcriptional regulator [Wenyingzhuangia fucanilytica]ANW95569.1 AraC family transcriptional regulator [Wenyingzhuangia fucanilytica]
MNIDYKTNIKVDYGFEVNKLRPVTTYSEYIENSKCANSHAHPRAQLISCDTGIMEVVTKNNIWIVNSLQSVWIASNEEHQVYFPNNVKVKTAFIDKSKLENLPKGSFAFETSDFLKSILEKIISFSNPNIFTQQQNRIIEVFFGELSNLQPSKTFLPTSQDKRIKTVLDALMSDLSNKYTIEYYASKSSVSPRTLSRLFNKELGMSFGDWKMRLKLMEAVKQLGENKSVKEIAFDLGYENVSSFIVTFKKHFGKTPTNYLIK